MKLLFVYRFCGLGGVETSILNKLDALKAEGIEGHVAFGEFYGSGGAALARDPRVTMGLEREHVLALLNAGFDAIAVVDHPGFVDLLDGWNVTARVLFETHASFPAALAQFYTNLNHPRVAAIIVPSGYNKRLVEASLHAPKEVVVIPNPLNERFRPRACSALESIPLPDGGPILLWVGRLEDEKNPVEFMRIGATLLRSGKEVRLLVVGDAYSNQEYAAYRQKLLHAVPEPWRNRFTFCQSVPHHQMPDVYSLAANSGGCLVSTSLYESAPMTFIEAMASMCPVVSSDVGGVGEIVSDGVTGSLYNSGDVEGAVAKISGLISPQAAETRRALVERARAVVSSRHTPSAAARKYVDLLAALPAYSPPALPLEPGPSEMIPGLVSTIIPVHNRGGLLREAVASVLAQTYKNIEIIIVDDGSTDDTPALCDQMARDHAVITAIHIPHQGRAGLVREAGRLAARGEYIQYLDSDDLLMPAKFAVMVAELEEHPDCDIAYCYTRRYRMGSTPPDSPVERTGETFETMLPAFLSRRYWCTSTPLYRRSLCDKAGPWTDLPQWEDIEYDIRLATFLPRLRHCKMLLTDMREHGLGRLSDLRILDDRDLLSHIVRGAGLIYGHVRRAGFSYHDEHVRSFIDDVRLMHDGCKHLGLIQEARDCAAIVMDATGIPDPDKAVEYTLCAVLEPEVNAMKAHAGESVRCQVRVMNESTVEFHGGDFATELSYRLLRADGTFLRLDNHVKVFEQPLRPGESRVLELWVGAPTECGLYYIEFDILWAGLTWLKFGTNSATFVKLLVCEVFFDAAWSLTLEVSNTARIESSPDQPDKVRLAIQAATTTTPWHIQLNYQRLLVAANQNYELRFRARADKARRIFVAVSKAHEPWAGLGFYDEIVLAPEWQPFSMKFIATATDDRARIHFDAGGSDSSIELQGVELIRVVGGEPVVAPPYALPGRLQMDIGLKPASYWWGADRGLPVHRYYLEQFLTAFAADIHGHCLEFQDPQYTPRFGGSSITKLDILHIDDSNPEATLVADLTQPNDLPDNQFDCIICSHVLHVIVDVERAIAELFRILKPGGVLLVAAPHISMYGPEYGEVWRFTPKGLEILLSRVFETRNVLVRAYGNSLTAAGEIRGVVSGEFLKSELDSHDPRFPVEVCARAVKNGYLIH